MKNPVKKNPPLYIKAVFKLYEWLGTLLYPFAGLILKVRAKRGKEDRSRRKERYGYASQTRPHGPLIWLHGASVGEVLAIIPIMQRIEKFKINVLITTTTVTAAEIVEEKTQNIIHQYMPMDVKKAVHRFLDYWQPSLVIFAESELWPNIMGEIKAREISHILVNARMSDNTFNLWRSQPSIAENIFGQITQVVAQSKIDGDRFKALGAKSVTVVGNLKSEAVEPKCDIIELSKIKLQINNRPTWIAVSTHKGEEQAIAIAHKIIKQHIPNIFTIIVPRHIDRTQNIITELKRHELNIITRSSSNEIIDTTDIMLGDSMGEIGLYLRLGKIAFMGKSLAASSGAKGGQNPLEPAMLNLAILSGKHVQNFREIYKTMIENKAVRLVIDEKNLAAHIIYLLQNDADLYHMRMAAKDSVNKMKGALKLTTKILDQYIMPLRVEASLHDK